MSNDRIYNTSILHETIKGQCCAITLDIHRTHLRVCGFVIQRRKTNWLLRCSGWEGGLGWVLSLGCNKEREGGRWPLNVTPHPSSIITSVGGYSGGKLDQLHRLLLLQLPYSHLATIVAKRPEDFRCNSSISDGAGAGIRVINGEKRGTLPDSSNTCFLQHIC